MSEQQVVRNEVVADYVRATMRVEVPQTLIPEIMRAAAATPQATRPWFHALLPFAPAFAAVAATALIVVVGLFATSSPDVGPGPDANDGSPAPTPRPTVTPEGARILTEPGDTIRIPAFDSEGQFGTITIVRGEERASYEGYIPIQAMMSGEVFFVEVQVTYEIDRATEDPYGDLDFGWAVDGDGDGLDADDAITQNLGYDIDGNRLESGPQPLLPQMGPGSDPATGWLALELPAAGAQYDIYLVQLAERDTPPGPQLVPFEAVTSALLRSPGEPVGVTTFDFDDPPDSMASAPPPTNIQRLPTPAPEPMPTFEPEVSVEADALLTDPQTCHNDELGVTVSFPRSWHTNDAYRDLPACTFFDEEPIDAELVYNGLTAEMPSILMHLALDWIGGATDQPNVPQAEFARVPYDERTGWLLTYADLPTRQYLVPLEEDAYGPFLRTVSSPETRAIVERMVLLLEFDD